MIKWASAFLLAAMLAVTVICSCNMIRPKITKGNWSEPDITVTFRRQHFNADKRMALIEYFYNIDQTASLRYPYTVWKGTAWHRDITNRVNRIAQGASVVRMEVDSGKHVFIAATNLLEVIYLEPSWFVVTTDRIVRITSNESKTVFSVRPGERIFSPTHHKASTQIVFCVANGFETVCHTADLSTARIEEQYRFQWYPAGQAGRIVYLSDDPKRTVFAVRTHLRQNNGALSIGIDPSNNQMIRTIEPSDIEAGATTYSWSLSKNNERILLKCNEYTPDERSWMLDLATMKVRPATEQDVAAFEQRPLIAPFSDDPNLKPPIRTYLRNTYLQKADARNRYPSFMQ